MCRTLRLSLVFCALFVSPVFGSDAPAYQDKTPKRYDMIKRASEIDSRVKEHREINFVFKDEKGKVQDLQHAVVDTSVAPEGKLVIWLMGHNQELFQRISSYGLHGIQVHYANGWFGGLKPEIRDDGTSLGKIRLEAATGEDHSPLVQIPKPDGMMERSVQFVKWLARENPQGRWEQFLTKDRKDLIWDKVIMSGISHGSTTAARFAKYKKVDRVVMFSGPRDNFESWQGFPSATPSNCYFGFTHVLDPGWSADHYCRSWELLGLYEYGPIVNVDQNVAPYENSRRLISDADVGQDTDKKKATDRAHSASVPGGAAIKDANGKYAHEAVWRYLFLHPVDQTGSPVPMDENCKKDQRK